MPHIVTDQADLIRRLEDAAKSEAKEAERWRKGAPTIAAHFDNRAALLREAAKALGGGG